MAFTGTLKTRGLGCVTQIWGNEDLSPALLAGPAVCWVFLSQCFVSLRQESQTEEARGQALPLPPLKCLLLLAVARPSELGGARDRVFWL